MAAEHRVPSAVVGKAPRLPLVPLSPWQAERLPYKTEPEFDQFITTDQNIRYQGDGRHTRGPLIERPVQNSALEGVFETRLDATTVLMIPHPVSHGRAHSYGVEIGKYLRDASLRLRSGQAISSA